MYDPTLPPGCQDADLEMMELAYGYEPPCPHCGAEDSFVNRLSNALREAAATARASAHGLRRRDVVTCVECGDHFDNRGGHGFAHLM